MNANESRSSWSEGTGFSTTRPLYGQVAIVTGAARGIGRQVAISLARVGAQVVINHRNAERQANEVADICRAAGSQSIVAQADVGTEDGVASLLEQALTLGSPSVLVNNAGKSISKLLIDTSFAEWNTLIQENLTSAFLCSKAFLPFMLQAGFGRIVNIASIWGMVGGANEAAYSAAKGGLIALTKAMAKEVARSGITVNAVAPGAIETEMLNHLSPAERADLADDTPVGRIGHPQDVANAVLYLASPASGFITGQVLSPNGGLII